MSSHVIAVEPGGVDQWVNVSLIPGIQLHVIQVADGCTISEPVYSIPHLMVTWATGFQLASSVVLHSAIGFLMKVLSVPLMITVPHIPLSVCGYQVIGFLVVIPGGALVGLSVLTVSGDCCVYQTLMLGFPGVPWAPLMYWAMCLFILATIMPERCFRSGQ